MSFLNLYWASIIALIVVPALVLLYFLKLRRRQEKVSSTLLWKKAVQDLQVNAPFQKLRKNLLLLLQLLVLAAALFALARPIIETSNTKESSIIFLIDRSASMNTVEEDGRTRLEIAKEEVISQVRTLNKTGSDWFSFLGAPLDTRVMVIAFSDRATVASPFTSNTAELEVRIKEIRPTDAVTNIDQAMNLAQAYLAPTSIDLADDAASQVSKLVLVSDGGLKDTENVEMRFGNLEYIQIGAAKQNIGITALNARRNPERPEEVNVFTRVMNFGDETQSAALNFFVDGRQIPEYWEGDLKPGDEVPIQIKRAMQEGGIVHAELSRHDGLKADDGAYAVVPSPRRLNVLLVGPGASSFYLNAVLTSLSLGNLDTMDIDQFDAAIDKKDDKLIKDGRVMYDVVIFDKVAPLKKLPPGNFLFAGAVPTGTAVKKVGQQDMMKAVWWDRTNSLLLHVAMENITVSKGGLKLEFPENAEILAEGPDSPIIGKFSDAGSEYIVVSFPFELSDWALKYSFSVFFYNVINYLGNAASGSVVRSYQPGEPFEVWVQPDTDSVMVCPDGEEIPLLPGENGIANFGQTDQVGLYHVEPANEGRDKFAVNLTDANEGGITPRPVKSIGTKSVAQGERAATSMPEIWRWFAGAAILLLLLEWYIYNRRVMI